jgi:hypothetical protein
MVVFGVGFVIENAFVKNVVLAGSVLRKSN